MTVLKLNLTLQRIDYDRQICAILGALRDGPRLAHQLPRFASALIEAESAGLCSAVCLERHTEYCNRGARSIWEWRITPAGVRWLKSHPAKGRRPKQTGVCQNPDWVEQQLGSEVHD